MCLHLGTSGGGLPSPPIYRRSPAALMRSLLALALTLALAAPLAAQPTFGLKAGLNVADVSNRYEDIEGVVDAQPRLGFVGGVLVDLPLSPTLGVRAEALYSQKGARQVFEDFAEARGGEVGDVTFKIDYLEVPLLARVAVEPTPTLEVGIMAGPAFAFKLNEGTDVDGEAIPGDDDTVESFDAGFAFGAEIGSGPFFVDLRYTLGLLNIATAELDEDEDAPRNGVFAVTGVFKLGR